MSTAKTDGPQLTQAAPYTGRCIFDAWRVWLDINFFSYMLTGMVHALYLRVQGLGGWKA
ncbi:hypothetical protein QBC41DRAFT_307793 [Cercophora samala]|uniref:Uncharacterized protein n=1 Tax=Cercophora samala TaxID=330535 RepID=A0AA40D4B5_9PEZI|nr:hypothetical protein QBC41DRAFT_307793 [Cercophora samala]